MVGLIAAMLLIAEGTVAWVAASFFGFAVAGWLVFGVLGAPTLYWLAGVLRDALAAERDIAFRGECAKGAPAVIENNLDAR